MTVHNIFRTFHIGSILIIHRKDQSFQAIAVCRQVREWSHQERDVIPQGQKSTECQFEGGDDGCKECAILQRIQTFIE